MWQSGCRCICVSRGRVGLRPPIRMPGWNSHCSLALSSGSFALSSAWRLLLGRKLITCFYDVNYFAEIFSPRFSGASAPRAGDVADVIAHARRASPRRRVKPHKTRDLRATHARCVRATSARDAPRDVARAASARRRPSAAVGRAPRVDLAKVRGFFPDRRSPRWCVAAKKNPRRRRRGSVWRRRARQAASADSSAAANASMSAADFVSVVHSSSASSMPA